MPALQLNKGTAAERKMASKLELAKTIAKDPRTAGLIADAGSQFLGAAFGPRPQAGPGQAAQTSRLQDVVGVFQQPELASRAQQIGEAGFSITPIGKGLQAGTMAATVGVAIAWLITLALIGVAIWRVSLGEPEWTDTTSIVLYAAAGVFLLGSIVAQLALARLKRQTQKAIDRPMNLFQQGASFVSGQQPMMMMPAGQYRPQQPMVAAGQYRPQQQWAAQQRQRQYYAA